MKYNTIRRAAYSLLIMALPLLSLANERASELFAEGNAEYGKAQFKEALTKYQRVLDGGYESAKVFYNMGNVYYRLGDMPSALLYYEKAARLMPADADVKVNIRLANSKITDKIEPVPEFFLTTWWNSFLLRLPVQALATLSIVLVLVGSGFLILYFYSAVPTVKRGAFYAGILLYFGGLTAVFIAGRQVSYFQQHRPAIIFSSPVAVKSAPLAGAKSLFILHEGTKVDLLEAKGIWMKIRLANGDEGWMNRSEFKEI